MLLNIALSLVFIRAFGYPHSTDFAHGPFGGLALAMSVATALESSALWALLRRRVGGIDERRVLGNAARTLLASLVMALAVHGTLRALSGSLVLLRTLAATGVGVGVFGVVALALGVEEARSYPRAVLGRLRR